MDEENPAEEKLTETENIYTPSEEYIYADDSSTYILIGDNALFNQESSEEDNFSAEMNSEE